MAAGAVRASALALLHTMSTQVSGDCIRACLFHSAISDTFVALSARASCLCVHVTLYA